MILIPRTITKLLNRSGYSTPSKVAHESPWLRAPPCRLWVGVGIGVRVRISATAIYKARGTLLSSASATSDRPE